MDGHSPATIYVLAELGHHMSTVSRPIARLSRIKVMTNFRRTARTSDLGIAVVVNAHVGSASLTAWK